jgi:hypothetical protein
LTEAITNWVTRRAEQRFDAKEVKQRAQDQLQQARQETQRALDFYNAINQIASDYCYKAEVRMEQVPPKLTAEQVREVKEYLPKMADDDYLKREFSEALPLAERELTRAQQERPLDQRDQDRDRLEPARDRDSGFRGR